MKFGLQYELQLPRPADRDQWNDEDELRIVQETLEQVELADKLGFDYAFFVEHHFLEEYCHCSAPEVILGAAAARTKNIRLGHGIVQMPPKQNHPARVAERLATLDLVSNGRVEFGTGEGATTTEIGGFGTVHAEKKEAWEEATRECLRMMSETPYPGYEGKYFSMPERNVIPKPLQKPHPPVWVAASRKETAMMAARFGIGALGFGFETPEEAEDRVARYYELVRQCRRPLGKAMNPALVTIGNLHCAPTDEQAVAEGMSGAQFFGFSFGWTHGAVKHGRDNVYREYRQRFDAAASVAEAERATSLEPEDESARALYRAGRRGMFMGSPSYIRENIRGYENAHMDALLFFIQCGDRKHEQIMASLELFAKEVMPEFKERHHLQQKWRDQQLDGVKFPINSSI
ncbi:MAG TPA: LLM class flavin-dependent oxidoreductase [Dehalococcoidia bacterium]|nr:LLM class flavin-dependent oxidoreductase [Dehalococcoidia bacterium]